MGNKPANTKTKTNESKTWRMIICDNNSDEADDQKVLEKWLSKEERFQDEVIRLVELLDIPSHSRAPRHRERIKYSYP